MPPDWSLYMVRTAGGALYTGITTDVERRLTEHRQGARGARALRGRGPLTLAFVQRVMDRRQALQLEWHIKQLSKSRKEDLVAGRLCLEHLSLPGASGQG